MVLHFYVLIMYCNRHWLCSNYIFDLHMSTFVIYFEMVDCFTDTIGRIGALPKDLDQSLRLGVLMVVVHEDRGPAPSALSNSWAEALWFSYERNPVLFYEALPSLGFYMEPNIGLTSIRYLFQNLNGYSVIDSFYFGYLIIV